MKFLNGVHANYVTITDVPLFATDGVNRSYVDPKLVPSGGVLGDVLVKNSATDNDVSWEAPSVGRIALDFYNSNGTQDLIMLTPLFNIPFLNSDGSTDNIHTIQL